MNEDQFILQRHGVVAKPTPDDPHEAWGVLNPASCRTRDGKLYLYPRVVAEGNFSRIERTRVQWGDDLPVGVAREGVALEPTEPYELDPRSRGGVEDPRITFVRPLNLYVMAYVALGRIGPRVAVAISKDGLEWEKLGLLTFTGEQGIDFTDYGNKDAMFFPEPVLDMSGRPALAILHRPTYLSPMSDGTVERRVPPGIEDERGSIWISYISLEAARAEPKCLVETYHSAVLASPEQDWEALKIGAGTPPILTSEGWLLFYHGVSGIEPAEPGGPKEVCYCAGAMILDRDDPLNVLYRSAKPVLSPESPYEREGIVPDVVFPTAVDVVNRRVFIFYGAGDDRIAVASADLDVDIITPPSNPG